MVESTYELILLAAGKGERSGAKENKVFSLLKKRPVLEYALDCFKKENRCTHMVLVIREEEQKTAEEMIQRLQLPFPVSYASGGETRQKSVWNGMEKLYDPKTNLILVHDGARPFVTNEIISRLLVKMQHYQSATAAIPSTDTLRQVENGCTSETLDRDRIWQIQTPQAFDRTVLEKALKQAEADGFCSNEETELVDRIGLTTAVVKGSSQNIKITHPDDWVLAECLAVIRSN